MSRIQQSALRCLARIAATAVVAACAGMPPVAAVQHHSKHGKRQAGMPAGAAMVWEDRGAMTPARVYWGAASALPDPASRQPLPPFSRFEKDTTPNSRSPKAKLTDAKGVKWTAKFGVEVHADTVAPRLAWALGFGCVEGYYVEAGKIDGVTPSTDLGMAKGAVRPDGTFSGGGRFKRHDKMDEPVKDAKGADLNWDETKNPGVPPEQLSGLLIFDALVNNWDAQTKNCKVYHAETAHGPQNWYIVSDMGASFADRPQNKFVLADYEKEPEFVKSVANGSVDLNFGDVIHSENNARTHIPLAHAQWFRAQLAKLTDDEIQAAFDAGFATGGLDRAYTSGDAAAIKAAREKDLSPQVQQEIAGFVATVRRRIDDYMRKVPER